MGLLLALSAASIAEAQVPQGPVTVQTSGGDVTIVADQLEQAAPDLFIATGNVEMTKGSARLMADRVELNRATGDAVAQGRVIFYDGEDQLTGQRIEYNVKTGAGVVYQGEARGAPYYRLSGEKMERLGESVYRVQKGVFTTCDGDPPDWAFHFGSATADLNEFLYGTNASFWVRNIPLIPFVPFFAAAIRRERQTGFLFPKFGQSSRRGFYAELPFFWAIDDSQDLTFSPLTYTSLGEGFNLEYRYILPDTQRGRFGGFLMQETAKHDATRFVGTTRQDWTLAPRTWGKVDVTGVSDDNRHPPRRHAAAAARRARGAVAVRGQRHPLRARRRLGRRPRGHPPAGVAADSDGRADPHAVRRRAAHRLRPHRDGPSHEPGVNGFIEDTSRLEYSLTNRLRGRTIALANAEPVRWELFRLTLGHAYDLRKDDWAEAFATLIVAPTPRVRFRSDLTYDPSANNVPSVTADVQTEIPRGALNAGVRYSDPAKITFLQAGFSVSPWAWLTTRGTINWDLYTTTFVENRLAFDLHWQCWALSIELINRAKRDDEIRFTLNLLGVSGPISTRVGLGAIESGGQR